MKVRIAKAVIGYLDGSGLWAEMREGRGTAGYGDGGRELFDAIEAASLRKDGSVIVDISEKAAYVLAEYADIMVTGALQNLDYGMADNARWVMPEVNSGRALLRKLADEGVRV